MIQYTEGDLYLVISNLSYDNHERLWRFKDLKAGSDSSKLGLVNGQTILKVDNQRAQKFKSRQVADSFMVRLAVRYKYSQNNNSTVILVRNKKVGKRM